MNKVLLYSLSLFFLAKAAEITKTEGLSKPHKLDNEYLKIHDVQHALHAINHDTTINNFDSYEGIQTPHLSHDDCTLLTEAYANKNARKKTAVGFWISKLAVHALAQTMYALVAGASALVYPAAAPVVYCSLQLTFAALVEVASTMIASSMIALG